VLKIVVGWCDVSGDSVSGILVVYVLVNHTCIILQRQFV